MALGLPFLGFAVLADQLGVAGYRAGLVLVAVPLVVGFSMSTWWLLRRHPSRVVWTIVAVLVGLTATAAIGARAPHSKGALAQQLDDLDLPFFEVERQVESGHSWCRPTCPRVERTYAVPDVSVQSTMVTVGLALSKAGLMNDEDLQRIGRDPFLRIRSDRLDVEVRVDEGQDGSLEGVRIRYLSRRPG